MDEATRAALASGRAEPALGLFVDSLMAIRGISVAEGDAIAGAALEAEVIAEMAPNALDMVFAAIERGGADKPVAAPLKYSDLAGMPSFLQDAILNAESHRAWTQAGPGIRTLALGLEGKARAEIIRVEAGGAVPWHTHKGQELTLCLVGEFSDGRGVYGPGEFSVADPSIRHRPKAHDKGPVYALAVTDAGLKFGGLLGALQKMFGG